MDDATPAPRSPAPAGSLEDHVRRLAERGITRVRSFAWRDLGDVDAGGSEVHADEIFRRWQAAGLPVEHRTSALAGRPAGTEPSAGATGYATLHRGGRYGVFARVIPREVLRRQPADTAVVEIWNGVPWFTPLWRAAAGVVWLHHVHGAMWDAAVHRPLNHAGRVLEARIAPPLYRRSVVATLSDSSRQEIESIGIPSSNITVIPPGVHARFTPDPARRSATPHVVVVGRLAPVKRMAEVLDSLASVAARIPSLSVEIVGEGAMRPVLEAWIAAHEASGWVTLAGRVDDAALVRAYQRAWFVVSGSHAEGWGMSLTEGAACATPGLATDIAGHRGAIDPDVSGVLVPDVADLGPRLADLLGQPGLVDKLRMGAVRHAASFSWDSVAAEHLALVVRSATRHRAAR